jgi:hypothetical protein
MSRKFQVEVFTYDELKTEEAKEKARDWFRDATLWEMQWSEFTVQDILEAANCLNIAVKHREGTRRSGAKTAVPEVEWSVYSSQSGPVFQINGRWSADGFDPAKVVAYAPQDVRLKQIAEGLHDLAKAMNHYAAHQDHEYSPGSIEITIGLNRNLVGLEEDDQTALVDSLEGPVKEAKGYLRGFMAWAAKRLEEAYEYEVSRETIEENIRNNEYTFLEDGDRVGAVRVEALAVDDDEQSQGQGR